MISSDKHVCNLRNCSECDSEFMEEFYITETFEYFVKCKEIQELEEELKEAQLEELEEEIDDLKEEIKRLKKKIETLKRPLR